eukprot:355471-Chlamydomonas_euryale.AAC.6
MRAQGRCGRHHRVRHHQRGLADARKVLGEGAAEAGQPQHDHGARRCARARAESLAMKLLALSASMPLESLQAGQGPRTGTRARGQACQIILPPPTITSLASTKCQYAQYCVWWCGRLRARPPGRGECSDHHESCLLRAFSYAELWAAARKTSGARRM